MKTLIIMRHAKSSWKEQDLPDVERPLTKKGRHAASRMSLLLAKKELIPQMILSSPAVRARQTTELVAIWKGYPGEIEYIENLYLAEVATLVETVSKLPDSVERVLLIAHNPGLESLLQILSRKITGLATGWAAVISLPLESWKDLNEETHGKLIMLINPEVEEEKAKKSKDKKEHKKDKPKDGEKNDKKKKK
jgi:phosphohistidine phosphatase